MHIISTNTENDNLILERIGWIMIVVIILLALLACLLIWDWTRGFHLTITAYATAQQITADVGFHRPILSIEIQMDTLTPATCIRLLGVRILKKKQANNRKPGSEKMGFRLARSASISGVGVSVSYGLDDPFSTAMAFAAAGVSSRFCSFDRLDVEPDFLSTSQYLSIQANATVKFGKTILNYIQNK